VAYECPGERDEKANDVRDEGRDTERHEARDDDHVEARCGGANQRERGELTGSNHRDAIPLEAALTRRGHGLGRAS
jgi:hypothetical protein